MAKFYLVIVLLASVVMSSRLDVCMAESSEYEVRIPSHDQGEFKIFSAKNFAIIFILVALIYLIVILVQICTKSDRNEDLSEEFITQDGSLTYDYYYDEEYTNSQYLRSDDKNSLMDGNFRYDQSLKDSSSRGPSSDDSDAVDYRDLSYRVRNRIDGSGSEVKVNHSPQRHRESRKHKGKRNNGSINKQWTKESGEN